MNAAHRLLHRTLLVWCFLSGSEKIAAQEGTGTTPPPAALAPDQPPKAGNDTFWQQDGVTGDWFGLRKRLGDAGVGIGAVWVGQGFRNFRGGIHVGNTSASTFDINVTLDSQKLAGFGGGKFYVDVQDHAGPDPSSNLVGDLEKFTKLNYTPFLQVAEVWYEQKLVGDKVRLKIGKVDGNTEYSVIDNGLPFLSSSTQVSPTIFLFPTYPDPQPSVNVFLTPTESFYLSLGAYYSNRHSRFLEFSRNPASVQPAEGGGFFIAETGLKWPALGASLGEGNLRVGIWDDTGKLAKFRGGEKSGTQGWYAIIDQKLWKPDGKKDTARGLGLFLEYAQTPGDVTVLDRHVGGGLLWTGPSSSRPKDMMGATIQNLQVSDAAGVRATYEQTFEAFYRVQMTGWASIQPDIQYIWNPAGTYRDALVGMVNIEVHF